jgi:lysophospholipase L1-like esterase
VRSASSMGIWIVGGWSQLLKAAVAVSVSVALVCGVGMPAEAVTGRWPATPPVSGMSSPAVSGLGAVQVSARASAADDVTITLAVSGLDPVVLQRVVAETQAKNARLSDTLKQDIDTYALKLPRPDASQWVDFNGTLSATAAGPAVTIPGSELHTDSIWWQKLVAGASGILSGIAARALCVAGSGMIVACASIGAFIGSFVTGWILQAYDHTLDDPEQWASTVVFSIAAAVGAAAWEAGINAWARDTLPGLIKSIGDGVIAVGRKLGGWLGSAAEGVTKAGTAIKDFSQYIYKAARDYVRPSVVTPARLRVMPLGDSITDGIASSSGNGYRAKLGQQLSRWGYQTDFVGSTRSGNLPDPDHEGHSGWVISQIADAAHSSVPGLQPTVVLVHAGTNDMDREVDPAGAPARLAAMVDRTLSDAPDATVLVATIVPAANSEVRRRINQFNRSVRALVRQRQEAGRHVDLIDLAMISTTDLADGLHPNDGGYDKMGDAFFTGIQLAALKGWLNEPRSTTGSCTDSAGRWVDQGVVATGVGSDAQAIRIADLTGDGRDDYIDLNQATGAAKLWVNGGASASAPNGWLWMERGVVATGVGSPSSNVRFADLNGDQRSDYVVVDPKSGGLSVWVNGGASVAAPNGWVWFPQGQIATGVGADPSATSLILADIDGDLRDDYLSVNLKSGAVDAWLNKGASASAANGWLWVHQGVVATGVNARALTTHVDFAKANCDKRADYLVVDHDSYQAVDAWINGGAATGAPNGWVWIKRGRIASGIDGFDPSAGSRIVFGDLDNDGRDDYLHIRGNGAIHAYTNKGGDPDL